ncbi:hypothetical protein CCDG5_1458 [[Clostridium] cellulosi]|jgi:conserved hypothetical protein TIGR00051|uniref:Uncharacterized protein n=1 Tax=[Clostridium] cellulosi TaxID=29343 RepID=A0A078KQ66_9FIRM|nr:MAG: acyl-CoA thioesterase [[Clostridium] cellulosi]CDZ24568.1 hypothetical protein CCDG5_1458 [[Clostridium] cellulosi]
MISQTKIVVRYAETDQMGVVHHSVYPIWFEAARTDFFKSAGYSYAEVEKEGFYLPVVELKCRYISSAVYGKEYVVKTRLSNATYVKLFFDYEIVDPESGQIIVKGETMHAWTDKTFRPVNIKKRAPSIYNAVMSLVDKAD